MIVIVALLIAIHSLPGECLWLDGTYHYVPNYRRLQEFPNTALNTCFKSCIHVTDCKSVGMKRADISYPNSTCYYINQPTIMLDDPIDDSDDNLIVFTAVDEREYHIQYYKHVDKVYPVSQSKSEKFQVLSKTIPTIISVQSKAPHKTNPTLKPISKKYTKRIEKEKKTQTESLETNALTQEPYSLSRSTSNIKKLGKTKEDLIPIGTISPQLTSSVSNVAKTKSIFRTSITITIRSAEKKPTVKSQSSTLTKKRIVKTAKKVTTTTTTKKKVPANSCIFKHKQHGGKAIKKVYGIPLFHECRKECVKVNACNYYTWWAAGSKKGSCFLRRYNGGVSRSDNGYTAHKGCKERLS